MDIFLKTTGGILVSVVLALAVEKREKDIAILLSMAVCCMCLLSAAHFLRPVVDFVYKMGQLGDVSQGEISALLKIVGIGLVTEVSVLICQDGGNASLGKSLQITGCAAMLYFAIPLFEILLDVVQSMLGEL